MSEEILTKQSKRGADGSRLGMSEKNARSDGS